MWQLDKLSLKGKISKAVNDSEAFVFYLNAYLFKFSVLLVVFWGIIDKVVILRSLQSIFK